MWFAYWSFRQYVQTVALPKPRRPRPILATEQLGLSVNLLNLKGMVVRYIAKVLQRLKDPSLPVVASLYFDNLRLLLKGVCGYFHQVVQGQAVALS